MSSLEEYGPGFIGIYGESEPVNVGFFIDKTWRFCWPRVVSRAWAYQISEAKKSEGDSNYDNRALLIEAGQKVSLPSPDDRWYMDLLSHDPYRTKKALEAEGMVFMADADAAEEDWQKWIFTKIVVRTRTQEVNVKLNSGEEHADVKYSSKHKPGTSLYKRGNMLWHNVSQGLGHFVVLTLPPAPEDAKFIAQAISDYRATNKIYPLS